MNSTYPLAGHRGHCNKVIWATFTGELNATCNCGFSSEQGLRMLVMRGQRVASKMAPDRSVQTSMHKVWTRERVGRKVNVWAQDSSSSRDSNTDK